ncbi:MAG TPA: VWA domain-containing protein [Cyclobacteriaceae bacterium]|nr:VWA domain-containing protein [Cyclobacteriaceae bacterium]
MTLFRDFGWVEGIFLGLFAIAYGLYLFRIIRISRLLNTPYATVFIKLLLRSAVLILLIIAILGPTFGDSKREIKSVGKDIMICVDLSKSMDAFDVQPTRLEKIKFEMKKIVAAFNSDRLGVIIFSSEAFMQCPLTYDQNALNLFIETMNTSLVPGTGTDFGPPIKMALSKLEDQETPSNQQKSKVIVLISDGEDFGEETNEIAKEVEDQDIRLFTLGVGTEHGSQIATSRGGFKTDQQGNTVVTKLNPSSLKNLASKTDGQYFEINESRNDVNKLINAINKIEGQVRDARLVDVSANRYFYFLLAALILLVLDVLVSVRTVRI